MQFNPKDLIEYTPVEEGDYEFVVVEARDTTSKQGNEMVELELQFEVGRDKPITVFGRLVNTPKALWVIKEFCQAVSPHIEFEAGQLQAVNCIGLTGTAHLILGEENDKGRRYMEIDRYIVPEKNSGELPVSQSARTEDGQPEKEQSSPVGKDDWPF